MISLVFGWFLSIVISEIFWYSGRVTGIFILKKRKFIKQLLYQQAGMYCTAIFYLNEEKGKSVHCKMSVILEAVNWLQIIIL